MPSNALYSRSRNALAPSVDQAVLNAFGMQPGMDRLNLLPRHDKRQGWIAPNALYQIARALVSPGVAAQGGYVSPEDAVNFAGNVSLGSYGTSAMMRDAAPGAGKTVTIGGMSSNSMPKNPSKRMISAYDTGKRLNELSQGGGLNYESMSNDLIQEIASYESDPVLRGFLKSGENGDAMPVWVSGTRYGDAPASGVSYNKREGIDELGVSMASVDHPDFADYKWHPISSSKNRMKRNYEGWLLQSRGGDNEPLMVGLKKK